MNTCQISRCLGYAFDVSDAAATAAAAAAAATAVTAAAPAVATTVAVATAIAVSAATATVLPFFHPEPCEGMMHTAMRCATCGV